jgi:hypothetical protein
VTGTFDPRTQPESRRRERRRRAWLVACVALGCLLRLTGLDVHSLWFDEGGTLAVAKAGDWVAALKLDRHPPLTVLSVRAWIAAFGESDAALRALPALASCASLALFAAWSRGCARSDGARIAAVALFAVAPFQVWHGQELRMYTFVELGALLALVGVDRAARGHARGGALLAFAGTAFATGNHYLGALAAPTVLAICAVRRRELGLRAAAVVSVASAAGVLAWAPWIALVVPSQTKAAWVRLGHHDLRALLETPARQVLAGFHAVPWRWAEVALAAVLTLGCASLLVRAVRAREPRDSSVAAAFAVPIVLAFAADAVFGIGFLAKYAIVAAPGVTLAAAEGLLALPTRALRFAALGSAVLGCLAWTLQLRSANRFEDFRSACAEVRESWRSGDRIVVIAGWPEPFASGTVRHYLRDREDLLEALAPESELDAVLDELRASQRCLHVVHRGFTDDEPSLGAIPTDLMPIERRPRRIHVASSLWIAPTAPRVP